ncbi:MAG: hypothetical protein IJD12_03325 [Tidjanibacter sp.]|nr:hypothetical protein [Tidjanibacter sp.]
MEIIDVIVLATPLELGTLVDRINRKVFSESNYNDIAVRATYAPLIEAIDRAIAENTQYLSFGHENMESRESGGSYVYNVRQAIANLKVAKEVFSNPPLPSQEQVDVAEQEKVEISTSNLTELEEVIRGVKGLAKYLHIGSTLAQAVINSKLLQENGAQYSAGGKWFFNREKLDRLLAKKPELLKDVHIQRRKK